MGKELGLKIKQLRSDYSLKTGKKCTQADLAKMIGISRSYLGDIESGRTNPSDEILLKLSDALNVNFDILIEYKLRGLESKSSSIKEEANLYETGKFETPEAAMQFILKQPAIMGYGGFDTKKMSEQEIIDFANEILKIIKMISPKYTK
ncbi:MAG: helix-turn-helix transcriptional regulator [Clostridium perfringens]|nr:helix-turn-helix transcriptional regulator [Clostridium perfringens]